jgi:thiamine-phosphate pyrophosphorylase
MQNIKMYRLIDANANRLKEGLRVIEDITRFIADDKRLTRQLKDLRHNITDCLNKNKFTQAKIMISERQTRNDVGKKSIISELKREDVTDIFLANAQRVKESIRVLEEFLKLFDKKSSERFKTMRYNMYHIEKRAIEKICKLCNNEYKTD